MVPSSLRREIIYVELLDEGTPTARPAYGLRIGANTFVVLLADDYDPEDEHWEYPPGSIVVCNTVVAPGGKEMLLARSRVDAGPLKEIVNSGPSDMTFA
jgi:hypothetical protein